MPYNPRSGKDGRVVINGATLNLQRWDADLGVEEVDAAGFETDGADYPLDGLFGGPITVEGRWDASASPNAALVMGAVVVCVLYISKTLGIAYTGSARVLRVPAGQEIRGAGTVRATLKAIGLWTAP